MRWREERGGGCEQAKREAITTPRAGRAGWGGGGGGGEKWKMGV